MPTKEKLRVGSVCSGVGGFELGLHRADPRFDVQWMCEYVPQRQKVLRRHWPNVPVYPDIAGLSAENVAPIDMLVGGTPCQDLSVAGKRKGFEGERSGLFHHYIRLLEELQPRWAIWENVPGLLSSDDGRDFPLAMDAFQSAGYVPEANILNSQDFGVPQRRKRVFVVCLNASLGRKRKTPHSLAMLTQVIIELLLLLLDGPGEPASTAPNGLASISPGSVDGLRRRMTLFDATTPRGWLQLLDDWAAILQPSVIEPTGISGSPSDPNAQGMSIGRSLPETWADLFQTAHTSITSMATTTTTEEQTFSCAETLLIIAESIIPSLACSPSSWNEASSGLTATEGVISYARQAASSLFGDMERVPLWLELAERAEDANLALLGAGGAMRREVLPVAASGEGDPAAGGKARAGAPRGARSKPKSAGAVGTPGGPTQALTSRFGNSGPDLPDAEAGWLVSDEPDVAPALTSRYQKGVPSDGDDAVVIEGAPDIAAPLTRGSATGEGVSEPGRRQEDDVNLVAFDGTQRDAQPLNDLSPSLRVGKGAAAPSAFEQGSQVRRLTPTECERLQGFPDGWTIPEGPSFAEVPSYYQLDTSPHWELRTFTKLHAANHEEDYESWAETDEARTLVDGRLNGTLAVEPACIHADAIGRAGEALTPSPDAEGRVRLRDAGLGVRNDGQAYNLTTGAPHADGPVHSIRTSQTGANGQGVAEELAPTLDSVGAAPVVGPLEREVTHAEAQAGRYDLGEALLQIAVVLSSITLFTRKRVYFLLGLSLGVAGIVVAVSALLVS